MSACKLKRQEAQAPRRWVEHAGIRRVCLDHAAFADGTQVLAIIMPHSALAQRRNMLCGMRIGLPSVSVSENAASVRNAVIELGV